MFLQPTLSLIEHLSPFHILWDVDGKLVSVSPKASNFYQLRKEQTSGTVFHLTTPFETPLNHSLFDELTHVNLHIINPDNPSQVLRGELIKLDHDEGWMFSGLPAAKSVADIHNFGLQIGEMPRNTGLAEIILATESIKASLLESQRINEVLTQEISKHQESKGKLEKTLNELKATQEVILRQERLKVLGETVSGIAHDFSNILTPIMVYSDILQDASMGQEERNKLLVLLSTATSDGAALISRLRSSYNPDHRSRRNGKHSLYQVIQDAIALAQPRISAATAPAHHIEIIEKMDKGLQFLGAEDEIRQAILNLLLNAGDALETSGTIEISTGSEGDHLWIKVTDSGKGMSPVVLKHCQDAFYSTKGKQGTGLGLSMVSDTASRHGGRVKINSTENKGTTVSLYLACEPDILFETPHKTRKNSGTGREPLQTQFGDPISKKMQLRVLLVDDDPVIRHALELLFEKNGHNPMLAVDGAEGLLLVNQHPFDLIVTDLDMPKMRGDDLAVATRAKQPNAAIILLSGNPEKVKENAHRHLDCVLEKPIEPAFVLYCGQSIVNERRSAETSPPILDDSPSSPIHNNRSK
jgi:signal transduction histidine kinase/CheY-like chemotaxis protein